MLGGLGGALKKVIISRLESNTYFAEMIIWRNGEVISVDARPSDSIAVALRTKAEIFADDELLERRSIETSDGPPGGGPDVGESEPQPDEALAAEKLKEYLRKLGPEDFGRFTP